MIKSTRDVAKEQKKNEKLIHSMLPNEVLKKMRLKEELVFDYPSVTIVFCQICDFTKISSVLNPDQLVKLLNIVFSAFDKIVDSNFVYKVETVGEVYMAAAGLSFTLSLSLSHAHTYSLSLSIRLSIEMY